MRTVGIGMIIAFFMGLFALMWSDSNLKTALKVFGITAAVVSWISLASYLVSR